MDKFNAAQERLREQGWNTINPIEPIFQEDARKAREDQNDKIDLYTWFLLWDMYTIAYCDAIYMLKDWKDSGGATAEYNFAKAIGKELIFE